MAKSKRVCIDKLDRLTDLPPEVIDHVLKRLPLRDAVRTSVLSKKWRFRWMYISELVFDARSIPSGATVDLVNFVNHVLLLHNANIVKFEVIDYLDSDCNDIHRWILLLARKAVQQLTLGFQMEDPYEVPSSLYTCQNLTRLTLGNCVLKLHSGLPGFNNLTHLDLEDVSFTNETIARLLLNNPRLKKICLFDCDGFTHLDVSAPNLKYLIINECCDDIKFDNTPTLHWVYIKLLGDSAQNLLPRSHKSHNFKDALPGLINTEGFYVYKTFMEKYVVWSIPERSSLSLDILDYLYLDLNFKDSRQILIVLCFLRRCCSSLQEVIIESYQGTELLALDEEFWEERQHEKEIMFPKLRSVTLTQLTGMQYELGFIQFLLMKGMVLETLHVEWDSSVQTKQVLEDMLQFTRASPRAKVISTGGKD